MKLLILIALTIFTFSVRSEARTCNLHIQSLDQAVGDDPSFRSKLERSLLKKGHVLVSEAELREGDLLLKDAFMVNRQGKYLPSGSRDLTESFTSVLMGLSQGKRLAGCEVKGRPSLTRFSQVQEVLMNLEISFQEKGEKDRGCRSMIQEVVERTLEQIVKKVPSCQDVRTNEMSVLSRGHKI